MAAIGSASAFYKGHDLSSAGYMETDQGAVWKSASGSESTLEAIMGAGGMDSVRLRIWTGTDYGLDYTLDLAKRFSQAGYSIFLDMHFSDTWADPSNQAIPSSWSSSSVDSLASDLRSYVKSTLQSFSDAGVDIAILSLGNEIPDGFLFPLGKINNDDFSDFATLWSAARSGVADAVSAGVSQPEVMIHLNNGWDTATIKWFFQGLFAEGTVSTSDVDAIGLSFYPFYGTDATLDNLGSTLSWLESTYASTNLYVAETDWPVSCDGVTLSADYPVSAEGQTEWVAAIIEQLQSVSTGSGIFYWEGGYLNTSGLGSDCDSALLFSVNWDDWPTTYATALSSVDMYSS
ncbi:family 53 glycosyl hydrolase [Phyllosticta capitalensis]|uniref:Arabinogalactan endo-beta-1,4-galactanase n=1 Tax=Phyllosticta capitalensis TaxID=121624 RepID=A0ABR1YQT4_9PEZI